MGETPRGSAIIWTASLGILTSFTVGSTITVATLEEEILVTAVTFVVSSSVLYQLIVRNWERWSREQPLVRIVVYFMPLFFGTVTLDALVYVIVGWQGLLTTVLDALVAAVVFAIAVWLSFYRGVDLVRAHVVDALDAEW